MANPFAVKFNSQCQNCESMIDKGDLMYAMDQLFICGACAEEANIMCKQCGGFKRAEYELCYSCSQSKRASSPVKVTEEKEAWDCWADPVPKNAGKNKDDLPF